jgi:hypothetical protein
MMGVELETDNTNRRYNYRDNYVPNEMACGMAKPKNFWVTKHDGSVSGPEFASNPATLAWWDMHRDDMEEMFRMLLHAGFRSHDGGHAGMHVNVSKEAFDSPEHLARFLRIIHVLPEWSIIMAQRTMQQANQWAHFDRDLANDRVRLEHLAGRMLDDEYCISKYNAINSPQYQRRLEFRLPRGTLRVDRFFKNLQWTKGMIEYTRNLRSLNTATPKRFMAWVEKNASAYPDLSSFMGEKREKLVAACA